MSSARASRMHSVRPTCRFSSRTQAPSAHPARSCGQRSSFAESRPGDRGARAVGRVRRMAALRRPDGRGRDGTPTEPRVFAPVTNRGEAIGVLDLSLTEVPDEQTLADVALATHALAYVVIAIAGSPTCS